MVRPMTWLVFVLSSLPIAAAAENKACAGVTKKCTKDTTYDKTIEGKMYRCYDCTQTLCKDGGDTISGTSSSSVCTEKASTFQPISTADQFKGGDTMAPTRTAPKRPRSAADPRRKVDAAQGDAPAGTARQVKFDEADALFGKRTSHADRLEDRSGTAVSTRDHRTQPGSPNTIVKATRGARPAQSLRAPTDLSIPSVSRTALTISWQDNSTEEYGVELYRAHPLELRRDPENAWEFIGLFQARIADRVTGTGMRMNEDYDLSPGTAYCYRMRAYVGFDREQVSGFSPITCASTAK